MLGIDLIGSYCSLCNLFGSLGSMSVPVLFESMNVSESSHSSSSGTVSSLGFGGPVISSLFGVEAAAALSVLPLLLMKV